jgi:hypothetical protein
MSFTTETLDKAYLEYSNITTARTAKELKLEQEHKLMRECLEMICLDNIYVGQDGWKDEYFLVVKNARECLNKLTKDEG